MNATYITVDLDGPSVEMGLRQHPFGAGSFGNYAFRFGVPRYLSLFQRHRIRATFFVPGYDAEVHPDLIRAIYDAGHEVAAHGYCHEPTYVHGREELVLLERTHAILDSIAGTPPRGWRNPGGLKSADTHQFLVDLGYRYDSSDKDAEVPFRMRGTTPETLWQLPTNTAGLDDGYLFELARMPPREVESLWRAEFESGQARSGYFPLILHARAFWGTATPARIAMLDRFLGFVRAQAATFLTGIELVHRFESAEVGAGS